MDKLYANYKNILQQFITEKDINRYLLYNFSIEMFGEQVCTSIEHSKEKRKTFFEEFDKLQDDKKYEKFIQLTGETSDWIKTFLYDNEEAKEMRRRFFATRKLFRTEVEEHINFFLSDPVLHQCRVIRLIDDYEHDELQAYLREHGEKNTIIKFLLTVHRKCTEWYGKLLFVYYKLGTDFIKNNYPDLLKDIDKCKSEEEKKQRIFRYGTDIVEKNFKEFEMVDDIEETSEWIKPFFYDGEEAKEKQRILYFTRKLFKTEVQEHTNICLNDTVLHQCRVIGLIDDYEHDELHAYLREHGEKNTVIKFLLTVQRKCTDWYGKLLYVHFKLGTDFIKNNYPDLLKDIDKFKSEEEKKERIFSYGTEISEKNFKEFEMVDDIEETDFIMSEDSCSEATDSEKWCSQLLRNQGVDHLDNLQLNESILFKAREMKLITDAKMDSLLNIYKKKRKYAKVEFLLAVMNNSDNWYGKLLQIFYSTQTDFIPVYLSDLQKMLVSSQSEEEKKNIILAYASSIIEDNKRNGDKNEGSQCTSGTDLKSTTQKNTDMETDNISSEENKSKVKGKVQFDCLSENVDSTLSNGHSNSCQMEDSTMKDDTKSNFSQVDDEKYDDSDDSDDDNASIKDVEFDKLFGICKHKSVATLLNFCPENDKVADNNKKSLVMRKYQEELAKKGIEGQNVLICSPTGSGKTVVAVKIVEEHLNANTNGKVAFLVHRIALVEQQCNQFRQYLTCRITNLSGSSKSSSQPLIGHLNSFDLFVLTSDILKNALEEENETKLKSISVFSLILFDECHNCDKKHPYNKIMNHYFKEKKAGKKVPQIIGLTASTGTNKASTMEKAIKRLYTLCANLDTYIVSTVKEFREDLEQMQSKPVEEILKPNPRTKDDFDIELQKQMVLCEKMLQEMNMRDYFPKDPGTQALFNIPEDRLHQKYQGFVGKLKTELYNLTDDKMDGRKAVFAITNYLNAFVRALMVNHLFRAVDAVKLITDSLDLKNDNPINCEVERILKRNVKKLEKSAEKIQPENPSLKCLIDNIEEQLRKDLQSRIIVFVRERNYTKILKNIFSDKSDLIRCEALVGNTIAAEQGGLTQNEMEEVLGRFRKGELNVLFATTVAEEGLDIQTCNLVIRYGHVTNETAMVQSRGRARAANSKYIVIVPSKLQWQVNKENINKYRESMMYRAIVKFQEMSEDDVKYQIKEAQQERELNENCAKISRLSINRQFGDSVWDFHCMKCDKFICKSKDIRLAEGAHRIVINEERFISMEVEPNKTSNTCQIKCKNCKSVLGIRQTYKNRFFPTLKIDCVSLSCENDDSTPRKTRTFKKWKDVPVRIADCTNQELLNYNPSDALSI